MAEKGIDFAQQTNIYKEKKQKKLLMKGMAFSFLVPIIALGMLGAVYFYKVVQERRVASVEKKIEQERSQRNFNELAELLSVSTKLNFVREFSQKQKFWSGFLGEITGKTFPSIRFTSIEGAFNYDINKSSGASSTSVASSTVAKNKESNVVIEMVASSLNDISKQIVAFEKSEKIETITIGDISLEDRGLVFTMTLVLAPTAMERLAYEPKGLDTVEIDISEPSSVENENPGNLIPSEELNNLNSN
ncbi:MAG: hypothetical protein U9Q72_01195 [Patescibacteria group bacterium]|nr:hypothetical protein [Patescibacteria group bacterium]